MINFQQIVKSRNSGMAYQEKSLTLDDEISNHPKSRDAFNLLLNAVETKMVNNRKHNNKFFLILPLIFCLTASGCSKVWIKKNSEQLRPQQEPDFTDTVGYYFFGLKGQKNYNVQKICFNNEVSYIRSQHGVLDLGIGLKTLFFYLPKTVDIWCEK